MIKKLLLILLMCAPVWAANIFTGDPNCKALYDFEGIQSVAITDKIGGNDMGMPDPTPGAQFSTTTYKEAAQSLECLSGVNSDILYATDASLDAGFPCSNGESLTSFSVCVWVRFDSVPDAYASDAIFAKWNSIFAGSFRLAVYTDAIDSSIRFQHYDTGTRSYDHASAVVAGRWYHIGLSYNVADDGYVIRIWDDTAGAILGTDKTGTLVSSPTAANNPWCIAVQDGNWGSILDGWLDELVVFNDVLTTDEIDQIRSGTYGAPTGPIEGNAFQMYYNPN